MRFALQLTLTFLSSAAGAIAGALLLRHDPDWQALGVLATLLAVGVALLPYWREQQEHPDLIAVAFQNASPFDF